MRTVEECRRLFAEFAFEEAGQLRAPVTFLPRLLRNAGCMPTTKDLQEIVREVNTNADGMLSFDDFLLYYSQTCTSVPSHADVQAALSEFFPEGQEAISSQALLSQLEEILPPEEAAELVALLGAGSDGFTTSSVEEGQDPRAVLLCLRTQPLAGGRCGAGRSKVGWRRGGSASVSRDTLCRTAAEERGSAQARGVCITSRGTASGACGVRRLCFLVPDTFWDGSSASPGFL
eukprot:TRINITY_DN12310_c0_g1_i1.p2 TRINITY_DN12310_c0_g1~~TRINITY_DN12310_c0_g1_i1.p2  ORF type:complete len:240 (-),score=30.26 TRINITY_DN12310_c0_g1_i1:356-1051(-)